MSRVASPKKATHHTILRTLEDGKTHWQTGRVGDEGTEPKYLGEGTCDTRAEAYDASYATVLADVSNQKEAADGDA